MTSKSSFFFILCLILLIFSCGTIVKNRDSLQLSSNLKLKGFYSDGCSMWPDGSVSKPLKWFSCCFTHDLSYWAGGDESKKEFVDKKFKQCIGDKSGRILSYIMHRGVLVGGTPAFNSSFRWGYGWEPNRGYVDLNQSELSQIKKLIPKKDELASKYCNEFTQRQNKISDLIPNYTEVIKNILRN